MLKEFKYKLGYKQRHYTIKEQKDGKYRLQYDIYKVLCYGLTKEYAELFLNLLNNKQQKGKF